MRRRIIEMDGESITISPITVDQADEYTERLQALSDERAGKKAEDLPRPLLDKYKRLSRWLVVTGINNALNGSGEQWKEEDIGKRLDLALLERLRDEILLMSKLTVERETDNKGGQVGQQAGQTGEVPAAS